MRPASLFGQARGYVGSNSYGVLTAALRDVPNAVVLLDEFEKAHPESPQAIPDSAWNDGFITEVSDGARVATNEAIFVLTTNAASRRIAEIAEQTNESAEEIGRLAKAALADAQFAPKGSPHRRRICVPAAQGAGYRPRGCAGDRRYSRSNSI